MVDWLVVVEDVGLNVLLGEPVVGEVVDGAAVEEDEALEVGDGVGVEDALLHLGEAGHGVDAELDVLLVEELGEDLEGAECVGVEGDEDEHGGLAEEGLLEDLLEQLLDVLQ